MRATRYVQMPEKAFVPLMKAFKTECCDCGLVHSWLLEFKAEVTGFQITRDNRATAQRRKRGKERSMRAKSWDGMRLALGVNDLWNSFCTWADINDVGLHEDDWQLWWQCYRAGASCGISPEQPEPGEVW